METEQTAVANPTKPEPTGLRVVVCGGRDYDDRKYVEDTLSIFHSRFPIRELIHGGARGVDTMAGNWARSAGIPVTKVDAEWDKYGKSAGYSRNVKMADMKPDCVVVFPGGVGTMMMKGIALKRKIEVIDHWEIV